MGFGFRVSGFGFRVSGREGVSARCRVGDDFGVEPVAETVLLDFEVVACLEVDPEALREAEVTRQSEGGVAGNGAFAVDDLVDALGGDAVQRALDAGGGAQSSR